MKIKTRTETIIDVYDWDKLVKETYGKPYNFQQQEDCRDRGMYTLQVPSCDTYDYERDSVPEIINGCKMGVSFKSWLDRDPNKPVGKDIGKHGITLWWHRNFYPHEYIIANDLYNKGLIDEGSYLIEVDW